MPEQLRQDLITLSNELLEQGSPVERIQLLVNNQYVTLENAQRLFPNEATQLTAPLLEPEQQDIQQSATSQPAASETITVNPANTDRNVEIFCARWNREIAPFTGEESIRFDETTRTIFAIPHTTETEAQATARVIDYLNTAEAYEELNTAQARAQLVDQRRLFRENYQPPFWQAVRDSLLAQYPHSEQLIPQLAVGVSELQALSWTIPADHEHYAQWQALLIAARTEARREDPLQLPLEERIDALLSDRTHGSQAEEIHQILNAAATQQAGATAQTLPVDASPIDTSIEVAGAELTNEELSQINNLRYATFWNNFIRPFTGEASITIVDGKLSIVKKRDETPEQAAQRLTGFLQFAASIEQLPAAERLREITDRNAAAGPAQYQPRNWRMVRTIARDIAREAITGAISTHVPAAVLGLNANDDIEWQLPANVAADDPIRVLFDNIDQVVANAQQAATDAGAQFETAQLRATVQELMQNTGVLIAETQQGQDTDAQAQTDARPDSPIEFTQFPPPPPLAGEVEDLAQGALDTATALTMQGTWDALRTINPNLQLPDDTYLRVENGTWSLAEEAGAQQDVSQGPSLGILNNFLSFIQRTNPQNPQDVAAAARRFGLMNNPEAADQAAESLLSNRGANIYWWQEAATLLNQDIVCNAQNRWEPDDAATNRYPAILGLYHSAITAQNHRERAQTLRDWCVSNAYTHLYEDAAQIGATETEPASGQLERTPSTLDRNVTGRSAEHRRSRALTTVQAWNNVRRFTGEPSIEFTQMADGEWAYLATAATAQTEQEAQQTAVEYTVFAESVARATPQEATLLIANRWETRGDPRAPLYQPPFWNRGLINRLRQQYFMPTDLILTPMLDGNSQQTVWSIPSRIHQAEWIQFFQDLELVDQNGTPDENRASIEAFVNANSDFLQQVEVEAAHQAIETLTGPAVRNIQGSFIETDIRQQLQTHGDRLRTVLSAEQVVKLDQLMAAAQSLAAQGSASTLAPPPPPPPPLYNMQNIPADGVGSTPTLPAAWTTLQGLNTNLNLPADTDLAYANNQWSVNVAAVDGPSAAILNSYLEYTQALNAPLPLDYQAAARLFGLLNDPEHPEQETEQSLVSNAAENLYWWQEAVQALGVALIRDQNNQFAP
ncbi:MAG: hypothetical protein ACRDAP_04435, partial [Shewanella sp.]